MLDNAVEDRTSMSLKFQECDRGYLLGITSTTTVYMYFYECEKIVSKTTESVIIIAKHEKKA